MDSNSKSTISDTSLQGKLSQVEAKLRQQNGHSAARGLPADRLAHLLFSKAPAEFLAEAGIVELEAITRASVKALGSIQQAEIIVEAVNAEGRVGFITALRDRPFIVNTIMLAAAEVGLSLRVLLHPITQTGEVALSLNYGEFELPPSSAEMKQFIAQLQAGLSELALITDDFEPMRRIVQTSVTEVRSAALTASPASRADAEEIAELLRWLDDGNFILMGLARWSAPNPAAPTQVFGILRGARNTLLLTDCREDVRQFATITDFLRFAKLRERSICHRPHQLEHMLFRTRQDSADSLSLVGFLSSKALAQEASSIPTIRKKWRRLMSTMELVPNSHDFKIASKILDTMPKDQLFSIDVAALKEDVELIMHARDEANLSMHLAPEHRGVSVLVTMPAASFSHARREQIQQQLETTFGAAEGTATCHVALSHLPVARLSFSIPLPVGRSQPVDLVPIQNTIARLCRTWSDNLVVYLQSSPLIQDADMLVERYSRAFPVEYQALCSPEEAVLDVTAMESLVPSEPFHARLSVGMGPANSMNLTLYSLAEELTISRTVPILEHCAFEVITESSARIQRADTTPVFVHRFRVRARGDKALEPSFFDEHVASNLARILRGQAADDALNALLINPGLPLQAVEVLRSYGALLWQVNKFATRGTIFDTMASAPKLAQQLWKLFLTRFNPDLQLTPSERLASCDELLEELRSDLRSVKDITKDRIFRALSTLIANTLRTNAFAPQEALAFKLHSARIDIMPQPRPLYEIFVFSPLVEGVHLRSGMVARGGIRWSDRFDDYRSEVLGLVKTQRVKNVVIVPTGAKGGFVLKQIHAGEDLAPQVKRAYQVFIRSLLSVSDNRVGSEVRHPARVIVHDGQDPYLVVAADKGTASFSDIANAIAVDEFSFWLGDAFASGGSKGYSHKDLAITAKGAWECAKLHLVEAGIDYEKRPFTVVGIGDMSGDVFGNGLLCSQQMQLIAAFDHRHIFIDPTPDPFLSYRERKRLFDLPRSQWSDYKSELVTQGGGIYGRFDKEIKLSAEARRSLGIDEEAPAIMSAEQVIQCILKAPADLLWNGGIGTYVKARSESHADVSDSSNDNVRVNADELRARVIGEGGNLGFTQKARIEFARRGGRLNTDAIDNSGGVDLSDHEVNLKILFSGLMREGKLTAADRDSILKTIAPDVVEMVLEHNRSHAVTLSRGAIRSVKNMEFMKALVRDVHRLGLLNRGLEGLPSDEEFDERSNRGQGLTRPELAVCIAAVKMWLKDILLNSSVPADPFLGQYLTSYFPSLVQQRFPEAVRSHPLAPHIIVTQACNTLIELVGITFVHRVAGGTGRAPASVAACVLAAEGVLDTTALRRALWTLATPTQGKLFLELIEETNKAVRRAAARLLSTYEDGAPLTSLVERYAKGYRLLLHSLEGVLQGADGDRYRANLQRYAALGFDDFSVHSLAAFPHMNFIMDTLWSALASQSDPLLVARIYSATLDELELADLLAAEDRIEARTKWEKELLVQSLGSIKTCAARLATELMKRGARDRSTVGNMLGQSADLAVFRQTMLDIQLHRPTVAALALASRQLEGIRLK